MKHEKTMVKSDKFGAVFIVFTFFFLVILTGLAAIADAYTLPPARRVTWQGNAGVSGDIPVRNTICATIDAGTYGNGTTDASTVINNAIANCPVGQVVYLPAGTYKTKYELVINKGITLRGAGMGLTIIKPEVGTGLSSGGSSYGNKVIKTGSQYSDWNLSTVTWKNITGNPVKGDTLITTTAAHGFSAGDWVHMDMLGSTTGPPRVDNNGSEGGGEYLGRFGTRTIGQMVQVVTVPSSTTFTINIPLMWDYNSTYSPQVAKLPNIIEGIGLEGFTIENYAANIAYLVDMSWSANSWMYHVELHGVKFTFMNLYQTSRVTLRGNKIHGRASTEIAQPMEGYGLRIWVRNTALLVEDNIIHDCAMFIMTNGNAEGNVFAYNYFTAPTHGANGYTGATVWFHGAYSTMNLFEGNIFESKIINDLYHGSSGVNTFYRNKITNETGSSGSRNWIFDLESYSQWYNIVGNVLGTNGYETTYLQNMTSTANKAIYSVGADFSYGSIPNDPLVNSTMLRHYNWDSVTKGTRLCSDSGEPGCQGGANDTSLPASLYLSSKPSWWGSSVWPPIGPDVPGDAASIPAKDRFLNVAPAKIPSPPVLH
ncbi:MAG: hypothetical protein IT392_09750 [Nitrospirae bacterium]|nr:hypothetical protein [Nitrospirota bacterium]